MRLRRNPQDECRSLSQLASVLEITAESHRNIAKRLPESDVVREMLERLADQMDVTAQQIMEGRYGDPAKMHRQ